MKKIYYQLISVIFSLSIILWLLFDYISNIHFFIIFFSWIVIPLNLGFFITLIIAIRNWIRKGFRESKIEIIIHGLVILLIGISTLFESELFKSEIILKAECVDDLSRLDLILRENEEFEMTSTGLFFYQETKTGKYKIENDTLFFSNPPYDNDFIPLKILFLPDKNKIYFKRHESGEIDTTVSSAQFFVIKLNNLTSR